MASFSWLSELMLSTVLFERSSGLSVGWNSSGSGDRVSLLVD